MQTPDTPRGRETERLMLLWRQQNPDAEASAYNREWDGVYRKLEGTFSDTEDATKQGFLDELKEEDCRYLVQDTTSPGGFVSDTPPKRRRVKNVRPATKGAFGKPKHLRLR